MEFSKLHQILLRLGYRFTQKKAFFANTKGNSGAYFKSFELSVGIFEVALVLQKDPHTQLPMALITKFPEKVKNRLMAHINFGGYLCYVDQRESNWDPNDLVSTYQAVDEKIHQTLLVAVESGKSQVVGIGEMEGEFAAYWNSTEDLYLLSRIANTGVLKSKLAKSRNCEPNIRTAGSEWITYNEKDTPLVEKWVLSRNLSTDENSILTKCFDVNPKTLVGMESWPPKNLKEILSWLYQVDRSARNALLTFFKIHSKTNRFIIIFNVRGQDLVGFFISFHAKATVLSSLTPNKRKKNSGRNPKLAYVEANLTAKNAVTAYKRLSIISADKDTIISRNRRRLDIGTLSGKRIALIGCGTIGGYLAELLTKSGAGCGSGSLILFDDDDFKPHNIGRHVLNIADCGENKAIALVRHLSRDNHLIRDIKAKPQQFPLSKEQIGKFDIILDATGRPPVSKRLSYVVRELPKSARPILIHGFNDGNGRVAKVMIDHGDACYGCLVADLENYQDGNDIRFKNAISNDDKRVSCGNTYTPYDSAVSVYSAGMMQEAALSCLEAQFPWTYSEHMLECGRSKRRQNVRRLEFCEICNGSR